MSAGGAATLSFTVYVPSLFGRDGAVPGAEEGLAVFRGACISAEFRAMAANQSRPVTRWLRALARLAHQECGGPGVGAIGMCFTGNFALTMMLEPSLLALVLSQPALPLNDVGCVRDPVRDALANPAEVLTLLRQKRIACPQIQLGVMVSCLTSELAGMTMN